MLHYVDDDVVFRWTVRVNRVQIVRPTLDSHSNKSNFDALSRHDVR